MFFYSLSCCLVLTSLICYDGFAAGALVNSRKEIEAAGKELANILEEVMSYEDKVKDKKETEKLMSDQSTNKYDQWLKGRFGREVAEQWLKGRFGREANQWLKGRFGRESSKESDESMEENLKDKNQWLKGRFGREIVEQWLKGRFGRETEDEDTQWLKGRFGRSISDQWLKGRFGREYSNELSNEMHSGDVYDTQKSAREFHELFQREVEQWLKGRFGREMDQWLKGRFGRELEQYLKRRVGRELKESKEIKSLKDNKVDKNFRKSVKKMQ